MDALTAIAVLAAAGIHGPDADSCLNIIRARLLAQQDMIWHLMVAAFGTDGARGAIALLSNAVEEPV